MIFYEEPSLQILENGYHLKKLCKNYYGACAQRSLLPYTQYATNSIINDETVIFYDDREFKDNFNVHNNVNKRLNQISLDYLEIVKINILLNVIKKINTEEKGISEDRRFICVMETGFFEDGIDIIIENFIKLQGDKKRLLVLTFDNFDLCKNYPMHNEQSRYIKNYSLILKRIRDSEALLKKTSGYNEIQIRTIDRKITSFLELINESDIILSGTRNIFSPLLVTCACISGYKVVMPRGFHYLDKMSNVTSVDSNDKSLSDGYEIPNTSKVFGYKCREVNRTEYAKAIQNAFSDINFKRVDWTNSCELMSNFSRTFKTAFENSNNYEFCF